MSHSHAKPVPLSALGSLGEFKAVHLEQVEEGVSHHVRDAVSCLQQTAAEPAHSETSVGLCRVKRRFRLHSPTFCHSRSETW